MMSKCDHDDEDNCKFHRSICESNSCLKFCRYTSCSRKASCENNITHWTVGCGFTSLEMVKFRHFWVILKFQAKAQYLKICMSSAFWKYSYNLKVGETNNNNNKNQGTPCVSASSLEGRGATSYAQPPPACPPETDVDPPLPQRAACTRLLGLVAHDSLINFVITILSHDPATANQESGSPSAAVHREESSHRTRPKAYMSMRRKESRWKLMAPSRTSGAM